MRWFGLGGVMGLGWLLFPRFLICGSWVLGGG